MNIFKPGRSEAEQRVAHDTDIEIPRAPAPMRGTMLPASLRQNRSEEYAQAAAKWHQLEAALEQAETEQSRALNHIKVMEERAELMQRDLEEARAERDYHKNRHLRIETTLRNAGALLVNLMQEEPEPASVTSSLAEIERQIMDRPPKRAESPAADEHQSNA